MSRFFVYNACLAARPRKKKSEVHWNILTDTFNLKFISKCKAVTAHGGNTNYYYHRRSRSSGYQQKLLRGSSSPSKDLHDVENAGLTSMKPPPTCMDHVQKKVFFHTCNERGPQEGKIALSNSTFSHTKTSSLCLEIIDYFALVFAHATQKKICEASTGENYGTKRKNK